MAETKCRSLYHLSHTLLALFLIFLLYGDSLAQRRGGGGGGRRKGGGGRREFHVAQKIKFRNPASDQYYNNQGGAKVTAASHFENEYLLGRKITFYCTAEGIPRPHITWFKNGVEIYGHDFFQIHEWKIGEHKLKAKMEIDPASQMDAGYYECQADNKYAVDRKGFRTDFPDKA